LKDLLFFSHNQKKIIEVNQIFKSGKINIQNLNNFKNVKEPLENGCSFAQNAKIKSKFGFENFKIPCFADDSGFCVNALNNKPGIHSKRFIQKFSSSQEAFEHIITSAIKKKNNKAFFVTAICLTLAKHHHIIFFGKINGKLSLKPKGVNGFGYDPIFIPENHNKTFAEMSSREKNSISHRKKAISKLKSFLF